MSLESQKEAMLHSQIYHSKMTIFNIFRRMFLGILKTSPSDSRSSEEVRKLVEKSKRQTKHNDSVRIVWIPFQNQKDLKI